MSKFTKHEYFNLYCLFNDESIMLGSIVAAPYSFCADGCYNDNVQYLHLSDFVIVDEHRNKGYGKEMLNEIEKLARKNDKIKVIVLQVLPINTIALNLYRKHGFMEYRYNNTSSLITMMKWIKIQEPEWDVENTFRYS